VTIQDCFRLRAVAGDVTHVFVIANPQREAIQAASLETKQFYHISIM
jgi:hypothetical protein